MEWMDGWMDGWRMMMTMMMITGRDENRIGWRFRRRVLSIVLYLCCIG